MENKLQMYPRTKAAIRRVAEAGWCDAEYCEDDRCKREHYHVPNCKCADCCALDYDL